jgi:hypothetical protein
MYLPVMQGLAASRRPCVVGHVDEDGRMEIYIGGRYSTGIGLVGTVSASGEGSRIDTRAGWIGWEKWFHPLVRVGLVILAGVVMRETTATDGLVGALVVVPVAFVGALSWFNLTRLSRRFRGHELPMVLGRLERALAPHIRQPPAGA